MGYTTDFVGHFTLNRKLDKKTQEFLLRFNETRRVARNVDEKYGVEGEFYVKGDSFGEDKTVIDYDRPPQTQPSLWCQWMPSKDGKSIIWDGGEKFYNYIEWIEYLIDKIFEPRGYRLNGSVRWQGEDTSDAGRIRILNNVVQILQGKTKIVREKEVAVSGELPPLPKRKILWN